MSMTAEERKERYESRKAAGICVKCGKPAEQDRVECSECLGKKRKYRTELSRWRKDNHICINCGNKSAEDGYTMCLQCRIDRREVNKRYPDTDETKQKKRERNAEQYAQRKNEGECTRCGRKLPENYDKTLCPYCRNRRNRRERERSHITGRKMPVELRGNGLYCAICLKPVEQQRKKLCDRCYKSCCEKAEKMRARVPKNNLFAKQIKLQLQKLIMK